MAAFPQHFREMREIVLPQGLKPSPKATTAKSQGSKALALSLEPKGNPGEKQDRALKATTAPKSLTSQSSSRPLGAFSPSGSFESFWKNWPKKVDRKAAEKAFDRRIRDGAEADYLIAKAAEYAEWIRRNNRERKYILHASTWLNGYRDEDELEDDDAGLNDTQAMILRLMREAE